MAGLSTFLAELKRRRVFRVAAVYGGIAFVLVQIVDGTFEVMGIPAWVSRLLIVLLALGFPLAVALAWVFDITPEGIVRTGKAGGAGIPLSPLNGGKGSGKPLTSNRALIGVVVLAVAFGVWSRWGGGEQAEVLSVAVLPFANMSNDPEQQYFSDGVAEEILNHLTHLPGLRVAGRTSSFSFRGQNQDLRAIGEALGVTHLLEGSVRRAGNRVRITAQLVKTADGFHIWSETYERPLTDIFAVQDEISTAIARALETHLIADPGRAAPAAREPDQQAYDLYLRARFHLAKRTIHDLEESVGYFERAVEADPSFARSWSGLAKAALLLTVYDQGRRFDTDLIHQGRQAADRAMALDPSLAEGYMATGMYYITQTWDHESALAYHSRAYELDPNDTEVLNFYGDYFRLKWDDDMALKFEGRAEDRDPLSLPNKTDLAFLYVWLGDLATARRLCEEALGLDPSFSTGHELLAMIAYLGNQPGELQKQADWLAAHGDTTRVTYYLTLRSVLLQDAGPLEGNLARLTRNVEAGTVAAYHLAFVYHELGDLENMARWFRLSPQGLGMGSLYLIRTMAGTIANHRDPAIRAILDRPEHKAYFDARMDRLR